MNGSTAAMPLLQRIMQFCQEQNPISQDRIARLGDSGVLLILYGTRNCRALTLLLQERKLEDTYFTNALQELQKCIKRVNEITQKHLRALFGPGEFQIGPNSLYFNRSLSALGDLSCDMVVDIQRAMTFLPNPCPHIRSYMLQKLPQQGQVASMSTFFNDLQSNICKVVNCLFEWFGQTTPSKLELPINEWAEMQMLLLRHEVYTGVSFYEAVSLWQKEKASTDEASVIKKALYSSFCSISPLYAALTKQSVTPLPNSSTVSFGRERTCDLPKQDTFYVHVIRETQVRVCRSLFTALASIVENMKVHDFTSYFCRHFEHEFADWSRSSYMLYFAENVSQNYRRLQQGNDSASFSKTLTDSITLLRRLLCADDGKLLPRSQRAYALMLGLLFYVHIVSALPRKLGKSFTLLDLTMLLDYMMKNSRVWLQLVIEPKSFTPSVFDEMCGRVPYVSSDTKRVMFLLYVLECFGCTAPMRASLSTYMHFIEQTELYTGLKFPPAMLDMLIQNHCLTLQVYAKLQEYIEWQNKMRAFIDKDLVDLPGDFAMDFCTWYINLAPAILDSDNASEGEYQLAGLVMTMLTYPLIPKNLSRRFSPFLLLASSRRPDQSSDYFREHHWAEVHNKALIELSEGHRAMRCELIRQQDKAILSILWLQSLSNPVTRRVEVSLPLAAAACHHDFFDKVKHLCDEFNSIDDMPDHVDPALRDFCKTLKRQIRKAVAAELAPIIFFSESQKIFCIAAQPAVAVQKPQTFQVSFDEYHHVFRTWLQKVPQNCTRGNLRLLSCCLLTSQGQALWDVDFEWSHKKVCCRGEGDDEPKNITKELYSVLLRLSDKPEVEYEVRYEGLPTSLLLCWQLALLKKHFYRLYPIN